MLPCYVYNYTNINTDFILAQYHPPSRIQNNQEDLRKEVQYSTDILPRIQTHKLFGVAFSNENMFIDVVRDEAGNPIYYESGSQSSVMQSYQLDLNTNPKKSVS